MAIVKERYEEIMKAGGFSESVISYLWHTRAADFETRTDEKRFEVQVKNTTLEQREQLEVIAERWKVRQSATS